MGFLRSPGAVKGARMRVHRSEAETLDGDDERKLVSEGKGPVSSLTGNLAHLSQERRHRQTLHEDGKSDDGEADRDDFFALWDFRWKSQSESQRQRSTQAAPEQDMLMLHRDAKRGA